MPMMFVAALMLAGAPAAPPSQSPIIVDKKKQVCEFVEDSGSRMRRRVCHDSDAPADPGVESATGNAGMLHAPPPAPAPGGVGAPPR
jgi:hypothetical protein